MGNCCSNKKKQNLPPKPSRLPPQDKIKFKSLSCKFSIQLDYHSLKSLSSYLNHLILNYPELASSNFEITKSNEVLKTYTKSLKDLGIYPGDTIHIELHQDSQIISSESVQNDEIAEEESTSRLKINGIKSKLGKVMTESTGEAVSLWMTAFPSPKQIKIKDDDSDGSSLNPLDITIGDKAPPKFNVLEIKGGQSVLVDSDESCMKIEAKGFTHPYDFFRDLQGPFSVLKSL